MKTVTETKTQELKQRQQAPLATPTDLAHAATKDIAAAMNAILADVFALYVKTKNFHWHMSGPHFRDYHLLLDEQAEQIFAMTDPIAERVRKIGGPTLKSIGQIADAQRVSDNDADYVDAARHARRAAGGQQGTGSLGCARRTTSAKSTATSRRQASSKSGSTRPSGGPGSCSRRAAGVARPDIEQSCIGRPQSAVPAGPRPAPR